MMHLSKNYRFTIVILLFLATVSKTYAQNINYAWTVAGGSTGIDDGKGVTSDGAKNVYAVGTFTGTVDFDNGVGVSNHTASGSGSGYITKYDLNGNFIWTLQVNGTVSATCTSVCSDTANNIYVIGEVNGTSGDFDPGAGVATFTSAGATDVYIVKYTSAGQFVWLQKFNGIGNEYARKIKMGKNGELVICCNFDGTVDFDPGPGTNNITTAGSSDVFIARFYTNGNLKWVKTIGNATGNQGPSIGIDEQGGIYSIGSFSGNLDTDPDVVATNFLSTTGNTSDGVIIKLDSNGVFQWSHKLNSNSNAVINDVQPDGNNSLYITGWFSGFVDLDPGPGFDTMTNVMGIDVFVLKMNYNGEHIWGKRVGNSGPDFYDGRSVKIDAEGNPIVLGIFEGTADFNPSAVVNNETSLGDFDIFIWGLDTSGNYRFSKTVGGIGKEVSADLHIDLGSIYFAGFFTAQVDFNPWLGSNIISPASTYADFHINKWNYCSPSASSLIRNTCDTFFTLNGQTYTASGIYTQNLTNIGGCDSILTLNLVMTNIDTAITQSANVFTANQSGASYQWYDCSGNWLPLANETQQSFTATQSGQYSVVISSNSCSDTSGCYQVTVAGIYPIKEKSFGKFYPNPSNGNINIEWNSSAVSTSIYIYNSLGQLVHQSKTNEELKTVIQINQPAGNYIVKIVTKDIVEFVPLVIQ